MLAKELSAVLVCSNFLMLPDFRIITTILFLLLLVAEDF